MNLKKKQRFIKW